MWKGASSLGLTRPQASFRTALGCGNEGSGVVVFSGRQHSPGDACQLVGQGDHDDVFGSSGVECVQPGSNRRPIPLDPQNRSSCTLQQYLEQVNVAEYTDATQIRHPARRVL